MTSVENALSPGRIQYVEEQTEGITPDSPNWQTLTEHLQELSVSPEANREYQFVVGSGSTKTDFRGAEEHTFTTSFYKSRGFIGSGGSANYPAADPILHGYSTDYPSHSFLYERERDDGGNFSAGFSEIFVAFGCKVGELSVPGDPSESNPITEEISWEAEKSRAYILHKLDTASTLTIFNDGTQSVDITVEGPNGSPSETITVAGGSSTPTVSTYSEPKVVWANSEHDGDIRVEDGSGNAVLDQALAGTDTDNVESEQGIPPLGAGSNGSSLSGDPHDYLFLGVDTVNWQGSQLTDRLHALDLTVSVDVSREAKAGTRRQEIDIGTRTAEADADVAGPYESAEHIRNQFRNERGDFVYKFPDNDVTLKNASISDAPDYTRSAGETNYIPSVTFRGTEDTDTADITVTYTGA